MVNDWDTPGGKCISSSQVANSFYKKKKKKKKLTNSVPVSFSQKAKLTTLLLLGTFFFSLI